MQTLLLQKHEHEDYKAYCNDEFWTREKVAQLFKCDLSTLWRWETSIIAECLPILRDYTDNGNRPLGKTKLLDSYQRFILATINSLKNGQLGDRPLRKSTQVKKYLSASRQYLSRETFLLYRGNK